jgi:AraC-like DNA-binding protein
MASVSSFNRNFQQVMGLSPRQYRATAHRPSPKKGSILPYRGWTMPEK